MPIQISGVAPSTRKPGAYLQINTEGAKAGLPVTVVRLLVIGVKRTTGSATALQLVQVFSAAQAKDLFGVGSPLAIMVEALLDQNPLISQLWCIPQVETAGIAAASTLTFAVSGLTAGLLTIYIGSRAVSIAVTATDTADTIAAAVAAALGDRADLPFSAAALLAVTTLTCLAKGTSGNNWVVRAEYTGTGLTTTIVQPAGGTLDPTITAALTVAEPDAFDLVVSQYNDAPNLALLKTHLDSVAGPMEQRPRVGLAGITGTLATNTTITSGVNSGRISVHYLRGTRTHPMELACAIAGALAAESDLARPLNFVALPHVLPPDDPSQKLTRTEQEACLANGLAPLQVGPGNVVQIVRTITTYVTDRFGGADDTLLDLQSIRVLDYTRFAVRTKVQQSVGQAKIASEAVTPNTTDPGKIRGLILGVLLQLQNELGYLERVEDHVDRLVVERDASVATRVNATIPADIVDGLHVFAGSIDFILG